MDIIGKKQRENGDLNHPQAQPLLQANNKSKPKLWEHRWQHSDYFLPKSPLSYIHVHSITDTGRDVTRQKD